MPTLIMASEALASGALTRRDLVRRYIKLYRNVYVLRGTTLSARDRAVAAWLWSNRASTVCGLSAAALLGSRWVPQNAPAELARAQQGSPAGIRIRKDVLADDEVQLLGGIPCTTAPRTVFDIGRRLPLNEAVIRVDALLNATAIGIPAVEKVAAKYPGARNIRQLRQVLELADAGAESPQETRVRLALIRGGLPRPRTQIPIRDEAGRIVRRLDMGWPDWKVGVEYDGEQHWTNARHHADDIDRLEYLAGLGWRIVRVSAMHLECDEPGLVRRAREALLAAGWRAEG